MTDLSVIILVGKEELHIKRCLERLAPLEPKQVFVIESQRGDDTHALAISTAQSLGWQVKESDPSTLNLNTPHSASFGARTTHSGPFGAAFGRWILARGIFQLQPAAATPTLFPIWHDWPGNQAAQFNWALDNLPIEGEWVLRLDADEYLYPETIEELKHLVTDEGLPENVTSLSLSLSRCFCGRKLHFTKDIVLVRAFRKGYGRSSQSEMDEHIVTTSGLCHHLRGRFVDDSLMPMDEWREKHRNYAKREAQMAISGCANANKRFYYKLPRYFRAFAYFCIRYFLKGGILDGYAGWMWNFWQGLWYRCLVDYEIGKMKKLGEGKR